MQTLTLRQKPAVAPCLFLSYSDTHLLSDYISPNDVGTKYVRIRSSLFLHSASSPSLIFSKTINFLLWHTNVSCILLHSRHHDFFHQRSLPRAVINCAVYLPKLEVCHFLSSLSVCSESYFFGKALLNNSSIVAKRREASEDATIVESLLLRFWRK